MREGLGTGAALDRGSQGGRSQEGPIGWELNGEKVLAMWTPFTHQALLSSCWSPRQYPSMLISGGALRRPETLSWETWRAKHWRVRPNKIYTRLCKDWSQAINNSISDRIKMSSPYLKCLPESKVNCKR